jgi:hypothetical protein
LSICRVKVNCQIRNFKITKLKQQVVPTYCHTDSTDVIENDYIQSDQKESKSEQALQIIGHVVAKSYANKWSKHGRRQFMVSNVT